MIEDTRQRGAQACGPGCGPRTGPMPTCSMAACAGMMGKLRTGLLLALPGAVLIAAGVSIILEPAILAWLAGAASVLAGVALLVMAGFVRRLRARPPD